MSMIRHEMMKIASAIMEMRIPIAALRKPIPALRIAIPKSPRAMRAPPDQGTVASRVGLRCSGQCLDHYCKARQQTNKVKCGCHLPTFPSWLLVFKREPELTS